jgi:hypothetical protein
MALIASSTQILSASRAQQLDRELVAAKLGASMPASAQFPQAWAEPMSKLPAMALANFANLIARNRRDTEEYYVAGVAFIRFVEKCNRAKYSAERNATARQSAENSEEENRVLEERRRYWGKRLLPLVKEATRY